MNEILVNLTLALKNTLLLSESRYENLPTNRQIRMDFDREQKQIGSFRFDRINGGSGLKRSRLLLLTTKPTVVVV